MASSAARERAQAVLSALRALPLGALDALADHATAPNVELLASVRRALTAADPVDALADALAHITSLDDATTLDPLTLLALGRELGSAAAPVRDGLAEIGAGRRALVAEGQRALARAADPALVALLTDTLAVLGDDAPFTAVREAVDAVGGAQALLGAVDRGDVDLAPAVAALRAQRDALAAAATRLGELPALLARARAYARDRDDRVSAAHLAVAAATLHNDGWPEALELALAAGLLPAAREAATRVEARALAAGDLTTVATTAARVAELAARSDDPDAELAAVCDEALARAQLPAGSTPALALVARAHALGAGAPARGVRAHLLEGQVTELLGDDVAARRAFRAVMATADQLRLHHELGWAALHLGRLEAAQGHAFRAGQNLQLAQEVGQTLGDSGLFGLAVAARIETAPDRDAAAAVLAQGDVAPQTVRAELQRRFAVRWTAPA